MHGVRVSMCAVIRNVAASEVPVNHTQADSYWCPRFGSKVRLGNSWLTCCAWVSKYGVLHPSLESQKRRNSAGRWWMSLLFVNMFDVQQRRSSVVTPGSAASCLVSIEQLEDCFTETVQQQWSFAGRTWFGFWELAVSPSRLTWDVEVEAAVMHSLER